MPQFKITSFRTDIYSPKDKTFVHLVESVHSAEELKEMGWTSSMVETYKPSILGRIHNSPFQNCQTATIQNAQTVLGLSEFNKEETLRRLKVIAEHLYTVYCYRKTQIMVDIRIDGEIRTREYAFLMSLLPKDAVLFDAPYQNSTGSMMATILFKTSPFRKKVEWPQSAPQYPANFEGEALEASVFVNSSIMSNPQ